MKQLSVTNYQKIFLTVFFLLITVSCSQLTVFAQDETTITVTTPAPPPLKIISKEEKTQLDEQTDIKKRTKLSLVLMEQRLKEAEKLYSQEQYREMYDQLGGFQALVGNTLDFLNQNDNGRGKVLGNFKRFEMSLRAFLPRLELIRRDLPTEFEPYVRKLAIYVRDARSKAVEPFFDQTIVKDNEN
ncbi:MAG: hypothetical protein LC768_08740 [Acidobacteria bacterium]|nr:hypothetical protein [Acidobacteriota bacterium]MCA1638405.1 hypothetical protein [Acidobacteriota bacterium]